MRLFEVRDPEDAFPDYSSEAQEKIERNRERLAGAGIQFEAPVTRLLATEDELLDLIDFEAEAAGAPTVFLDISSLPKRYFCLLLKRLIRFGPFRNVVVTYTRPGRNGYTEEHLAEDPMTCDHLPGFAAPLPPRGSTLVVSVGFESLSIRSLLEIYRDRTGALKIVLAFPSDLSAIRREWATVREMAAGDPRHIVRNDVEVVAAWDAELVYDTLIRWNEDSEGLILAPFGPKPHSLAMALFAMKHDAGLYYTQPKSYNPDYSRGEGGSWAYVAKWDGVPCFDRRRRPA